MTIVVLRGVLVVAFMFRAAGGLRLAAGLAHAPATPDRLDPRRLFYRHDGSADGGDRPTTVSIAILAYFAYPLLTASPGVPLASTISAGPLC